MNRDSALIPLKASALKPGDTVAIVAPASPPDPVSLDSGVRFLQEAGYRVIFGRHLFDRQGYLAGSDSDRASDFNNMIQNPAVRAIFCARGGYGTARIARFIDYDSLRADPKIIVGFSDITLLLAAIWQNCKLITFHGPVMSDSTTSKWSLKQMLNQLTGNIDPVWPTPEFHQPLLTATPEQTPIVGRLFGGCLSILVTLPGTPWNPDSSSSIFFIEEIGEAPYRIDRMLTHLFNAGWFQNAQAVLAGSFKNCVQRSDDPEPTPDTETLVQSFLTSLGIPFISGLPFGHDSHNFTIPFGGLIEVGPQGIIQLESYVDRCRSII